MDRLGLEAGFSVLGCIEESQTPAEKPCGGVDVGVEITSREIVWFATRLKWLEMTFMALKGSLLIHTASDESRAI